MANDDPGALRQIPSVSHGLPPSQELAAVEKLTVDVLGAVQNGQDVLSPMISWHPWEMLG